MSAEIQSFAGRTQPRRKASTSSNSPSLGRRQSSWEFVDNDRDQATASEDAMDTDDVSQGNPDVFHPLRELAERIGKEVEIFAEEFDKYLTKSKKSQKQQRKELIALVKSYKTCADDNVKRLRNKYHEGLQERFKANLSRKSNQASADYNMDAEYQSGIDELERWQSESHTWSLFQSMLECDYPDMDFADPKSQHQSSDRFAADGDSWRLFLDQDDIARERLKVLRWLETAAELTGNDVDIIEDTLASSSDRGSGFLFDGWMDTRERIKSEKRLRLWKDPIGGGLPNIQTSDGEKLLVTQLDPDSVFRQNRHLESPDQRFENAFWELCWEMFRRGHSMQAIQNWCSERNELARAFSIGAHAVKPAGHSTSTPDSRLLWRQACKVASEHSRSAYERAVYGLLAGRAALSNPPCIRWSDHLFALYNNHLLIGYLSFLKEENMLNTSKTSLAGQSMVISGTSSDDRKHEAKRFVELIILDPASQLEPQTPFEPIQAALISHDLVALIKSQGIALARNKANVLGEIIQYIEPNQDPPSTFANFVTDDPDSLRFLTHAYLVLKQLGLDLGTSDRDLIAVENILCGYLRFLLLAGKMHLLSVYASMLSKSTCVDVLGRVLAWITHASDQKDFVALMNASGIDVPEVLTHHVKLAMFYCPSIPQQGDDRTASVDLIVPTTESYWPEFRIKPPVRPPRVTKLELGVVQSLRWFTYIDGCWVRMFEALTEAVVRFFKSGAIDPALLIFESLPFADISKSKTPDQMIPPFDVTDESEDDHFASDTDSEERILSSQQSPQREERAARSFGEPMRLETPEKAKVRRALYKAHAMTYFELGQLAAAIEALHEWSACEEEATRITSRKHHETSSAVKKEWKKAIDAVVSAMEPLLHGFLTKPSPCASAEDLKEIRRMYLPQMILAYASALHCAGFVINRDHILQSMDLATNIADNKLLIDDIKSQGLMGTLVDTFARASKSLLHLKETGASKPKRKARQGSTLWEL